MITQWEFDKLYTSKSLLANNISLPYTNNLIKESSFFFVNSDQYDLDWLNPKSSKAPINFEFHCREACFRPYKDFCNLQTLESTFFKYPVGGSIYTIFSNSIYKNAMLTSKCIKCQLWITSKDRMYRTITIFWIGEKVSR